MLKVPAVKPSEMPTKLESTPTHRVFLKVGAVFSRFISSRRWKPALSDGSWGCDTLWTRNLRVQVAIIVRGSRRDLGDSACDVEFSTAVDVQILFVRDISIHAPTKRFNPLPRLCRLQMMLSEGL